MFHDATQDHPVIELVWRRFREGSLPGARNDPFKLGLAVEGGGMRGIVTAAILGVLRLLGLLDVFDVVYGSSAGASNAAYSLSQQWSGIRIYLDKINNSRFIKFNDPPSLVYRLLKGKPAIDLDFLFGEVMARVIPFDWETFSKQEVALKVLAVNADTGRIEVFSSFADRSDLLGALHASAHLAVLSGKGPFPYRGRRYFDSGILDPYCINTALA